MNMVFLNGSPKSKDSNSDYILDVVANYFPNDNIVRRHSSTTDWVTLSNDILDCDILLISFPLYVDAIPSHLLRLMEEVQISLSHKKCNAKVYLIVNCGFYDARQTRHAIKMTEIWAEKSGLSWGQGLGLGSGGMVRAAPIGKATNANFGKALDTFTSSIKISKSEEQIFVEPNFPRFLYMVMGNYGFRSESKSNGLKSKDLFAQPALERKNM